MLNPAMNSNNLSIQPYGIPAAATGAAAYPGLYLAAAQPTVPMAPLYTGGLGGYGLQFAMLPTAPAAYEVPLELRRALAQEMKVNWATSPSSHPKQDTSKHYHIFVGDLCPEVSTEQLRAAFTPWGEVSDCKVIKDAITQKPKGYGFISFVNKQDAENSIKNMNGTWLGSKPIRTNWATRKPPAPSQREGRTYNQANAKTLNFDEVYQQSSETNFTVYVGGVQEGLTEDLMKGTFSEYGEIKEVRTFPEKGYAFVRFGDKASACQAIVGKHGTNVAGNFIKCSWGKESSDTGGSQTSYGGGYGGGGGYDQAGYGGYGGYQTSFPPGMNPYGGTYGPSYGNGSSYGGYAGNYNMQGYGAGGPMGGTGGAGGQYNDYNRYDEGQ